MEKNETPPSEALILSLDVVYRTHGLLLSLYEEVLAERRRVAYLQTLAERGLERPHLVESIEGVYIPPDDVSLPLEGDASAYVGEVHPPIGVLLRRGAYFVKKWEIKNVGVVAWRDRFLVRVGPNAAATLVATQRAVRIPNAEPGEQVVVTVRCRAQWIESTSVAHFKMAFADGRLCWPNRYSHGVDLLVTATTDDSCMCSSCLTVGPLEPAHRTFAALIGFDNQGE